MTRDLPKEITGLNINNMGSSSIGCGGQNSLEAESLQPNSPLGERINDDEHKYGLYKYVFSKNTETIKY